MSESVALTGSLRTTAQGYGTGAGDFFEIAVRAHQIVRRALAERVEDRGDRRGRRVPVALRTGVGQRRLRTRACAEVLVRAIVLIDMAFRVANGW